VTIDLLVMTDGRDDYLERTMTSAYEVLEIDGQVWIHDDTGDDDYRASLAKRYKRAHLIGDGPRRGFGGAIRWAWKVMAEVSTADYLFHLEDDFVFRSAVDLRQLAALLEAQPYLAQLALKRQPWWTEPAGGFMHQHREWYTDCSSAAGVRWVETIRNWTTNPSLYRRDLCAEGWPEGEHSEGHYGFQLRDRGLPWGIAGDAVRFGFWGSIADPPMVEHIGKERAGTGY
jgi:hypothetical protein